MTPPGTHEMVVIHRVYRRESRLLPGLVRAVAAGDTARSRIVADYQRDYLDALALHHTLEDELVWPLLRNRASLGDGIVDRMERQHHDIELTVAEMRRLGPGWRVSADPVVREDLAAAGEKHRAALLAHLDDEEVHVLPLIARHLTAEEWALMGVRGGERTPRSKGFLTLGALLEEADAPEARLFLDKVPGPARVLWHLVGRRQYARYAARARGE